MADIYIDGSIEDVVATNPSAVPQDVNYVYVGSTVIWQRGSVYSYTLSLGLSYSTGTYILANGTRTATLTVTLKTYINSVYQSDLDALVDADSIVFTYEPSGCDFSATRTSLGTYTISAASRGTVPSAETDATIRVNYTPPSSSQIYELTTVSQEANAVVDTEYDTVIELSVTTNYDSISSPADAGGASWTATASGNTLGYERDEYTSGAFSEWVYTYSTQISAASISIATSGDGLSGSGTGSGTTITWASRGTVAGSARNGSVTASYSGQNEPVSVYQEANAIEYTDNHVITVVSLNGTNGNITVSADPVNVSLAGSGTLTEHYTSTATKSGSFTITASGFSVAGTGFTYNQTYQRVEVSANEGAERYGTVTATYTPASDVKRTITQLEPVSVPSVSLGTPTRYTNAIRFIGVIDDNGGGTISACGFNWGESSGDLTNPVSADEVVQSGNFGKTVTGLSPSTPYYYNAWATNEAGTDTTAEGSVTTLGIVHGSITHAQFQAFYVKADVTLVIYNDTESSVNLGVITGYVKQGATTIGSGNFNYGNDVIITSGSSFSQTIVITTAGASESYTYTASTSSIPKGVGVLQRTVTPPPI